MVRQLPFIQNVEITHDRVVLSMTIQPELEYFSGHFDGFPILPGVAQLDWALYFAAHYFEAPFEFSGMEVVKYQKPISPSTALQLELKWEREKNKLQFSYFDLDSIYSKGKVKLR
ncbi:ApeI family dehydratase [Vibrio sp. RC27]